ncbi:MAG: Ig-like domain-containing protein [Bacteroidota bacterium]
MIKIIRIFFLLAFFQFIASSGYAQFPYLESFRAATAPGITFGGAPSAFLTAAGSSYEGGTPIDPVGNGYLRLTNSVKNQKGYVYSNSDFPSYNGLRVDFEYYIYGGNGADGISFFLFDATASPFKIGGFGGSLGYSQITTTNPISEGVSKGYLGIGLDEFGNFSNPNEGRQGGPGYRPGSITLRGKGDGNALDPENYKFLTTEQTFTKGIDLVGNGAGRTSDSTDVGYRRVLMEMEPNPAGGYFITVKLKRGGSGVLKPITIIDRFPYSEAAPSHLRYGFASSTGDQTNFHEVRNVSIAVFNENTLQVPSANNDTKNGCPGNQVTIDVTANDATTNTGSVIVPSSLDLDPVTEGVQKTLTIAGKGTFTANNDGTVTFVASSAYSGNVATSYIVRDSYGKSSNVGTITVNYIAPSVSANAGADQFINSPSNSVILAGNDPGAGSTGLWTQVSGPSTAVFTNSSAFNSTASSLNGGIYIFRWTITSAGGCQTSDDVKVDVNRRPVAVNDNFGTNIDTEISIPILQNDTDPDGNSTINVTTVVLKSQPQNGIVIVDQVTGDVIYRPDNGFTGSDSFTYTVKDIHGLESNIAIVNVAVSLKPIGLNDLGTTTTNAQIILPVIDNDPGRTNATVVPNTNPIHGSVFVNPNNTITYIPANGYSGRDSFTYKLKNAGGVESDPITVTVNVKPVGTPEQDVTFTGLPVTVPVKNNDLSQTGTNVIIGSNPLNGSTTVSSSGEVVYTPNPGFSGKDSFTYLLRTADGVDSDPIIVNINVRPFGTADVETYIINTPLNITVKNNDASKTGTAVVINTLPSNGSVFVNAAGIITYMPNPGFIGTDTFNYILRTADGLDSFPITVTVSSTPSKPSGTPDITNTSTNVPVTIPVKDNDISQTGTTVVLFDAPLNGTITFNGSGVPIYTPKQGFSGIDTFTYKLKNAANIESDPITVTVNVKPTGLPDNVGAVNGATPIDVKNNDPGKLGTSVVINTPPLQGTVTVTPTGTVVYTPSAGYAGTDSFTYILKTLDGLDSDPIVVTLTSKPAGNTDVATTPANTAVTIPVKDNDQSKTGTTVIINTNPTNGSVVVNSAGVPVYTPNGPFSGKDTFTYKLRDANNIESDPINVVINVKPVGSADNVTTPVNTTISIPVKNNDFSNTGTTPVVVTGPSHGTVTIIPSGNAVFIPATGYTGNDTFTYKLTTSDGVESDPITVTVTINAIVPAPDITVGVPNNGTPTIITDIPVPPGGSVVITVPPKHGTITIDPVTGKPIYTPTPGYTGPDDFTYIIKDSNGNESAPGKVTITVTKPAKVGLAKSLTSKVRNSDGSYKLSYLFTIQNYGDVAINNLSLIDNLSNAFPARTFTITKLTGTGTLRVNGSFNGTTNTDLLLSTSTLNANFKEQVEMEVTLAAGQLGGTFSNSATVTGNSSSNGAPTTDVSTNGLVPDPTTPGDVTPSVPTQAVILIAQNINLPVSTDKPVTVPVNVPTGGSVVITNPPKHGTITFDPITKQPIYTPNPGYSGPDDFTYIIRDADGNESQPAAVTINVTTPAKIGLAKALVGNVKNADGSYNLIYRFTMVNYGDFAINNVSLTDNLNLIFTDASYQIISINTSATSGLKINPAYNGGSVANMLLPSSSLVPTTKQTVDMELKVTIANEQGIFNNFATVEGVSASDNTTLRDQSTDGFNPDPLVAGDVSPSVLTPVTLNKGSIKIPGGFSPNNDGINDFFVVENAIGKKVGLEVFNRWGNRVYRSKDYQNTWDGKTTEGIFVGDDVPVGTYYYIVTIDGKNKRVGYITINR